MNIESNEFRSLKTADPIAFSIVVYREVFYETIAFITLLKALSTLTTEIKTQIFIYDNTDTDGWVVNYNHLMNGISIYYEHNSINPGISIAYNSLCREANKAGYSWMVFLDQDTDLPSTAILEYLKAIQLRPNVLIKAPILLVDNKIFSPSRMFLKKTFKVRSIEAGVRLFKNFVLVNSGLLVNLSLFFKVGGYNENVKLDFADFLFLEQVRRQTKQFEILPFSCWHQFSHNETDINKALKRYSIFVKDLDNCPKNTLSDLLGYGIVGWLHLAKLSIKHKSLKFFKIKFEK